MQVHLYILPYCIIHAWLNLRTWNWGQGGPTVKLYSDLSSCRGPQAPNPCAMFEGHLYSFPSASPRVMWYIQIQAPQEEACGPRSCLWLDAQPPGPASGSPSSLQISTPLSNSAFIRSKTLTFVSPRAGLLCLSLGGFTLRLASTCIILDTSRSFSHVMGGLFLTSASFNGYRKKKPKSLPYSNVWLPSYLPCESQGLSLPCPVGLYTAQE